MVDTAAGILTVRICVGLFLHHAATASAYAVDVGGIYGGERPLPEDEESSEERLAVASTGSPLDRRWITAGTPLERRRNAEGTPKERRRNAEGTPKERRRNAEGTPKAPAMVRVGITRRRVVFAGLTFTSVAFPRSSAMNLPMDCAQRCRFRRRSGPSRFRRPCLTDNNGFCC